MTVTCPQAEAVKKRRADLRRIWGSPEWKKAKAAWLPLHPFVDGAVPWQLFPITPPEITTGSLPTLTYIFQAASPCVTGAMAHCTEGLSSARNAGKGITPPNTKRAMPASPLQNGRQSRQGKNSGENYSGNYTGQPQNVPVNGR